MILLLQRVKKVNSRLISIVLLACYLVIFILSLRTYIIWQSVNLILGLLILPLVTTIDENRRASKRFVWFSLLFVIMALLMPVKTLLFIAIVFAVLFLLEQFWGRVNVLPLLACFFMSPFFQYAVNVFSFDIRVLLTGVAGKMLLSIGDTVKIAGNVIEVGGNEFSVDPACMGLNMLVTSVMLAIALIGLYQKKMKGFISLQYVIIIIAFVLLLNIISNLLRILLLVKFLILPENIMHDMVGLLCLVVYVFLPTMFLVRYIVKKKGKERLLASTGTTSSPSVALNLLLAIAVALVAIKVVAKDKRIETTVIKTVAIPGYKVEQAVGNVVKLENDKSLVYIKPIGQFYEADHNPMICWKGSGYDLKQVKKELVGNMTIFTASLEKEGDKLLTAWWYDNGDKYTTSQLEWRWKMLQQAPPYSIINITCSSKEELEEQVKYFVKRKVANLIFKAHK